MRRSHLTLSRFSELEQSVCYPLVILKIHLLKHLAKGLFLSFLVVQRVIVGHYFCVKGMHPKHFIRQNCKLCYVCNLNLKGILLIHNLWVGPLVVIVTTVILWQTLGPSCLAGIAILLLTIPLQSLFGRFFAKIRFVY